MLERREEPNFIINNRPLNQFPAIIEKVTCPICCILFQKKYAPMISCPSGHTICATCLEGIIKKAELTPQNLALCPLCRKRIQIPLRTNEEYGEFVKLLESIGQLQFGSTMQAQELKQKGNRIVIMDQDIKKKNVQLFEMNKKIKNVELDRDKLKAENVSLKKTIEQLRQGIKKRPKFQSESQVDTKFDDRQNIKLENRSRIPNREVQIDSRPPLRDLFYDDELDENNCLKLNNKTYKVLQIEFLVFHDLSKIIELNLSCNKIQNSGFRLLVETSNFANLANLIVANNQITQLPANIERLTKLQFFNIGNYLGEDRRTCNKLRQSQVEKILEHKWQSLKTLDIQFDTDLVWDSDEILNKLVVQWPVINMINICTFTMKMTKKKCQQLGKTLNAKRPGLNRIFVGIKSNH